MARKPLQQHPALTRGGLQANADRPYRAGRFTRLDQGQGSILMTDQERAPRRPPRHGTEADDQRLRSLWRSPE